MKDALRAAVFARDKGICSFSGLSVWYLDYGTAPFSHADWVDHVVPKSKNGKDKLDNLVCASFFYNRKKLNNGSDRQYLFKEGRPTETFFWTHGELTSQQAQILSRHKAIEESDWYFNRALFNITVAIGDELAKANAVRTREYWLAAAQKRMAVWKKLTCSHPKTFARRGLVRFPHSPDIQLMLSLATARNEEWLGIYKQLVKFTRANEKTFAEFLNAQDFAARSRIVQHAANNGLATAPLIDVMKKSARRI